MPDKVKANEHESYWSYTLIALVLPIVGIILGIVYLTKDKILEKKLGEHMIAISVLFIILQSVLVAVFWGNLFTYSTYTPAPISSVVDSPIIQSRWDPDDYYNSIKTGQSKPEVEKITGKKSRSCTTSETEGVGIFEICSYGDVVTDQGEILITYFNNKVQDKTKTKL